MPYLSTCPRGSRNYLFVSIFIVLIVSVNIFAGGFNDRRETIGVTKNTVAVAEGDFDNDKNTDLVQITDSQITVLKGYGNGTFEACSSVGIASNAGYDVAVGDFNQDGNLDAVVVHFYLAFQINQVSIFFGEGTCKLDNETLYSIGERAIPSSVDVGDFTGDGYPDLAITSFTEPPSSQFYLLKNNGSGQFPTGIVNSIEGFANDVKVGKINNDNNMDAVVSTGGKVGVFYGAGNGTFSSSNILDSLYNFDIAIADFNADNRPDVAVSSINGSNSYVRVFLNSSTGFPNTYQQFGVSNPVRSIVSADFNLDGKADVVTSNTNLSTLNEIDILYGNGNGTLQSYVTEKSGPWPLEMVASDFNHDSKPDLAIANCCDASLTLSLGVLQNAPNAARYFTDFDGDIKTDAAVVRPSSSAVWWVLKSIDLTYYAVGFGYGTDVIVPANYDGRDAKADIAVYRNGVWYILQSTTGTVSVDNFGLSSDKPVPADYDNDGFADVAIYRPSSGLWVIKYTSTGQVAYIGFGLNGDAPVAADYDGDGMADIAVYRPSDHQWYLSQSRDGFLQVSSPGGAGDIPVPGDYDGDGKFDISAVNGSTWRVRQSSNSTVVPYSIGAFERPVPGEYTGDNKNDVAIYNAGTWSIRRSENGSNYPLYFGLTGDKPIPAAYVP